MRTKLFWMYGLALCFLLKTVQPTRAIPAFPNAEGFGAQTTGGRGGRVIAVTTLAADGAGSLNAALAQSGKRTIVFKVSGVINATANIVHGDVTIAGQTSPGGITVRGLVADGHYERNKCDNIIVRHIRSRPATFLDGNDRVLDDALRLDGVRRFVIDHCSFANASDEAVQVSWASKGTIQNCILAETVGPHAEFGGMLLNYSHPKYPQDYLSIHHNMWHRIAGRMPEITMEASNYPDLPGSNSDGIAHPLRLELSNNLLWDPAINVWYTPLVDNNEKLGAYRLQMNWVNNYLMARPNYSMGMIAHDILAPRENSLYFAGNKMNLYPELSDAQLAYCCNDFNDEANRPNTDKGAATMRTTRHPFPAISYTPTDDLIPYMIKNVGAFPRDAMDTRYIRSLRNRVLDLTPRDKAGARDAFRLNFDAKKPPLAPLDTDRDGMPNMWEKTNGSNPRVADNNGVSLSPRLMNIAGYTNLECYLHQRAESLVASAK